MKEISSGVYPYLEKKSIGKKIPFICNFELTYSCNLNCLHCYNVRNNVKKELSTGKIKRILDKISNAGCLWVKFTGGDPLIRKDFPEIYLYARSKGMVVTVLTNGTLLDSTIVNAFLKMPPLSVEVSVYGASPFTYLALCGSQDAYFKCREGLKLLKEKGINFEIKSVVTKLNKNDIFKIKDLSLQYGCKYRYDTVLYPRVDGSWFPDELILNPKEVISFDFNRRLSKERFSGWNDLYSKYLNVNRPARLYTCNSGISSFSINPQGKMNICHMLSSNLDYDLLESSFEVGVQILRRIHKQKLNTDSRCNKCSIYFLCNKCSALDINSGYYLNSDCRNYYCYIAKLRSDFLRKKFPKIKTNYAV